MTRSGRLHQAVVGGVRFNFVAGGGRDLDRILNTARRIAGRKWHIQIYAATATDFLLSLAKDVKDAPDEWKGFGYLNSSNPAQWDTMLYKVLKLKPGGWDTTWTNVVNVTKAIAYNWRDDLSQIISSLRQSGISIEDFFKLERTDTFKLSALLGDANEVHKIILNPSVDISGFVGRMSRAFLPSAVYHLEEYGLPRMISKKIHAASLINFEDS